ncbi:MAG: sigma-70 family RNA polymerase sigma factor [Gammaproteobacteria bacterium]|nr:sigma-70 family RNA polymerase sigma factor [Gammaproteobacteria bacterium]
MSDKKEFFTKCIHDNMDSLFSVALRLTKNNADAEDLVADATVKAWSAIDSLADKEKFRPWIFRILHNCYISDYRKKAIRPVETCYEEHPCSDDVSEVANLLITQSNDFLNWWANPEREVINCLMANDMVSAIESLPEQFRITVVLINIEGLSYDETAEVLGVSPGTVRSRMNRGRTLLQKALWQHAQDAGLISTNCKLESEV